MAINDMSIEDISTVANAVIANAQGDTQAANTSDFVSIADVALKTGYDPLATAISQVLSKTVFSYRPYSAKFKGIYRDTIAYGNHVRKLTVIDKGLEKDSRLYKDDGTILADGDSVDQYKINKADVLQTNYYGAGAIQKSITIFKDQMDTAFHSAEEFGNFMTMYIANSNDVLEQAREDLARGTVANLIGSTYASGNGTERVVKLLTEYNTMTGLTLTATTVMLPDNFKAFMQFVFARIQSINDKLTERTFMYHLNPRFQTKVKNIRRHTPQKEQHCYMLADFINKSDTMALANTFNAEYLKKLDFEKVNFWQFANDPYKINTTVSYLDAGVTGTGARDSAIATAAFNNSTVIGVIFDTEACGINMVNQWSQPTPFNAKGGYYNQYWHETDRWYNDTTENSVVLLLA